MTDFEIQQTRCLDLQKIYLGQTVKTHEGIGIVVGLNMPTNGLYISPENSKCVVWFGTNNTSWVQREMYLDEILNN